jgi:hypothetical protein
MSNIRSSVGAMVLLATFVVVGDTQAAQELPLGQIYPSLGYPPPIDQQRLQNEYLSKFLQDLNVTGYVFSLHLDYYNNTLNSLNTSIRRSIMVNKDWGATVAPDDVLRFANRNMYLRPAGAKNPFTNVPDAFKQFGTGEQQDTHKVYWLAQGWIPKNWPDIDVNTETDGTIVIRVKDGHRGWPIFGVAAYRDAGGQEKLEKFIDWAATPEANVLMGSWFYVVPDNSRLHRRVRIDLIGDNGSSVASTPCNSTTCYPTPITGSVTVSSGGGAKTYNVCGTTTACPSFDARPGYTLQTKPLPY